MNFKNKRMSKRLPCLGGALLAASVPGTAQQPVAEACSAAATETLNSRQLPPPAQPFGGVIKEQAKDSKPCWPARVVPPKGAPNVLLIMTDDVGFGAPSTFGGVIPTPALDRIAQMGLRYTNFHSTALSSPTRAALITGRNHHTAGYGVISEMATGFPGYNAIIEKSNGTVGEILRQSGMQLPGSARPTIRLPSRRARRDRSTDGRPVWGLSIFTASSAETPTSGRPEICSGTPRQSIPMLAIPVGTSPRPWRTTRLSI